MAENQCTGYVFESLAGKALLTEAELEPYLPWSDQLPKSVYSEAVAVDQKDLDAEEPCD